MKLGNVHLCMFKRAPLSPGARTQTAQKQTPWGVGGGRCPEHDAVRTKLDMNSARSETDIIR